MNALPQFRVRAVLIDLDGTLLDTIDDLAAAANAMLGEMGHPLRSIDELRSYVGKGADALVHRALTGSLSGRADAAVFEPAVAAFRRHYAHENGTRSRFYPGVLEGLVALRAKGLKLACVTNKPIAFTEPLLDRTGLRAHFDLVLGGDSLPRKKPDPDQLLHACAHFCVPPQEALMIGDSVHDAHAARAAGMSVLTVPYGYNEGQDVDTLDVDAIVGSIEQASRLISCIA